MAPRDITPGMEWAQAIVEGINECRVFVLIFSAHSNSSSQVRREVERAANHERPIIPFRIDNVVAHPSLEFFISSPPTAVTAIGTSWSTWRRPCAVMMISPGSASAAACASGSTAACSVGDGVVGYGAVSLFWA